MSQLQEAARAATAASTAAAAARPEAAPAMDSHVGVMSDGHADEEFAPSNWVPAVGGAAAPEPGRWRTWAAGAGVIAVALVAGIAVLGRPSSSSRTVERPAQPAPAAPDAAPAPAITAELTTRKPTAPSRPAPVATAPAAQVPAAAPAAAPPRAAARSNAPAMLTVFSRIPLDIYYEGKKIGTTDDGQLLIPPGQHRLEFVSRRFNYRGDLTMSLEPGQVASHTVVLPSGQLRLHGPSGTEVLVEGERMGALPMADVTVPIGTRELLFRHPLYGDRRQTVEVGAGGPTDVTAAFPNAPDATRSPEPAAQGSAVPRLAPLSAPPAPKDAIK
jgi:hypothetical protein